MRTETLTRTNDASPRPPKVIQIPVRNLALQGFQRRHVQLPAKTWNGPRFGGGRSARRGTQSSGSSRNFRSR